ncbi:MAG: hypothetical protein ACTHU0_06750 [Kofleriaceae bacterium]
MERAPARCYRSRMRELAIALTLSMSVLGVGACKANSTEPTTSGGPTVSLARAEALLSSAGHWIAIHERPRWSRSDVALATYRSEPDSQVTVFVYVFPSAASASAAVPEIEASRLDGARSRVVQRDELVFFFESPMGLPGRPLPPNVITTFDAAVASVSRT